jgi:hypothetical protein
MIAGLLVILFYGVNEGEATRLFCLDGLLLSASEPP